MGKRGWLDQLIHEQYLPAIAALDDSPSGHEQALVILEDIRAGWAQHGATALNQQQSLMDQTRRAIKDRFGEQHFSLNLIDLSRDDYFQLNHQKQERARTRQLHQQYIKDPDAIVAVAVRTLDNSPEWAELAAALAVVTGRRLNEVLKTAHFTVVSQWVVRFSGALKRRGEDLPLEFDIPTLTTAKRVVEASQRLRQITPADAVEANVAIASDRLFHLLVPPPAGKSNLYTHLWRSLYCCIATFWYCPKHVDDLLFKAHIMGHFEALSNQEQRDNGLLRQRLESFASERHYRLYEIDDHTIAQYGGKRKGVKLGLAGIAPLVAFTEGLPDNQPLPIERKRRSSLRIWKHDHERLSLILNSFDGKTQQDKVSNWIHWSHQQLAQMAPLQDAIALRTPQTDTGILKEDITQPLPLDFSRPPSASLEAKLDQLLDVMAAFVQTQTLQKTSGQQEEAIATNPISAAALLAKTAEPVTDNAPKPRKYKTGLADSIINHAIDAIIAHNDSPGRTHDDKWAISINALKNFSSNQRVIQKIIQQRKQEIDDHLAKHQLNPRHNDRHKHKSKINQIIHI